MITLQTLMNRLFTLMAISGLLLAGYALLITPDEIKDGYASYGFRAAPAELAFAE